MTSTKPITLYSYRSQELLSLADTVSACSTILEGAIALLYSPDSCKFLRLSNSKFEDVSTEENKKEHHELSSVFEARIFTPDYELRWLNRGMEEGDAILLTEQKTAKQPITGFQEPEQKNCERLEPCQRYLLWGKKTKNQPRKSGWQRLAEARIGKLDIPLSEELKDNQSVYLKTYEYMAEWIYKEGNKEIGGNYAIIEERLVKLEVVS